MSEPQRTASVTAEMVQAACNVIMRASGVHDGFQLGNEWIPPEQARGVVEEAVNAALALLPAGGEPVAWRKALEQVRSTMQGRLDGAKEAERDSITIGTFFAQDIISACEGAIASQQVNQEDDNDRTISEDLRDAERGPNHRTEAEPPRPYSAGVSPQATGTGLPPTGQSGVEALQALQNRLDRRLNDYLCNMKPDFDDSITGFNQAWEVVTQTFKEASASPAVGSERAAPVAGQEADPMIVVLLGKYRAATERNKRVAERYDELMHAGRHGHYETMFQVVREEVERSAVPAQLYPIQRPTMSERDPEAVADWRAGLDHRDWLFDGHPIRGEEMLASWNELDWTNAYVDLDPSVTGNPGPYWHVPRPSDDTVHRLYPKVLTGKWLLVIRRACEEVARSSRDAALEEAAKVAAGYGPDRGYHWSLAAGAAVAEAIRSLKSDAP